MDTLEKLKVQKILSALTIAIGFVLMSGKIYADSEPGAIPMLLVVLGTGWYLVRESGRGRVGGNLPGVGRRNRAGVRGPAPVRRGSARKGA